MTVGGKRGSGIFPQLKQPSNAVTFCMQITFPVEWSHSAALRARMWLHSFSLGYVFFPSGILSLYLKTPLDFVPKVDLSSSSHNLFIPRQRLRFPHHSSSLQRHTPQVLWPRGHMANENSTVPPFHPKTLFSHNLREKSSLQDSHPFHATKWPLAQVLFFSVA